MEEARSDKVILLAKISSLVIIEPKSVRVSDPEKVG
jgi:hypothetical protein